MLSVVSAAFRMTEVFSLSIPTPIPSAKGLPTRSRVFFDGELTSAALRAASIPALTASTALFFIELTYEFIPFGIPLLNAPPIAFPALSARLTRFFESSVSVTVFPAPSAAFLISASESVSPFAKPFPVFSPISAVTFEGELISRYSFSTLTISSALISEAFSRPGILSSIPLISPRRMSLPFSCMDDGILAKASSIVVVLVLTLSLTSCPDSFVEMAN